VEIKSKSLRAAQDRITSMRLPTPPGLTDEEKDVQFPSNLGELDDIELDFHRSFWTRVYSEGLYYLAMADTNRTSALSHYEYVYNQELLAITPEKGQSKREAAAAENKESVRKAKEMYHRELATYTQLKALVEGYNAKMSAVSRELTKRINEKN
jgi:hypothetical protein